MNELPLIIIYLLVNSLFFWLRRRPVKHYYRTRIDNKIPLIPLAVAPYVSYYALFVLSPIMLYFSPYFSEYVKTMIIAQIIASLVWYFFPNGMIKPEIIGRGRTDSWLRWLYRFSGYNGCAFPSAHTYHSIIMGLYLCRLLPQWQIVIVGWVSMIVASTVLTKQHYVADIASGFALALLAVRL